PRRPHQRPEPAPARPLADRGLLCDGRVHDDADHSIYFLRIAETEEASSLTAADPTNLRPRGCSQSSHPRPPERDALSRRAARRPRATRVDVPSLLAARRRGVTDGRRRRGRIEASRGRRAANTTLV